MKDKNTITTLHEPLDAWKPAEKADKTDADALNEGEINYQALFNSSFDAISILDPDTSRFIHCNDAALRLYGAESREALLGLMPGQVSPTF